jgi:ABC-type polysaccharide/polyol phosphate transport system ATPase subunit
MEADVAIKVEGVDKSFRIPHERYTSLKQSAIHLFTRRSFSQFEAVKGVSVEIKKGEFFGIVGRNGSGKSTLLKLLAGIYVPTKGLVRINGALSPFIELGVGFNPELTARENIFLNGAILGLTRRQLAERFDDIIGFAELEEFVDQKLKNFSSGMQVRLAFSIAVQAQSEILLIDEVLAVGDSSFQKKCFDVFKRLKREGKTIVFVTHDMANVQEFCDRVLVMHKGRPLGVMGPDQAAEVYHRLNAENDLKQAEAIESQERWGSGDVRMKEVRFLDSGGAAKQVFKTGDQMTIELTLDAEKEREVLVGLAIYSSDGLHIAGPNSSEHKILSSQKLVNYRIERLPLTVGTYLVTAAIFDPKTQKPFDYRDKAFSFAVTGTKKEFGNFVVFGQWDR